METIHWGEQQTGMKAANKIELAPDNLHPPIQTSDFDMAAVSALPKAGNER
jgi:hypothetical protein